MQKTYDPKEIESKWGPLWEKAGYFKPSQHGKPYCIVLPPPNVTGTLHMGHGFQQTLMDVLIRYHRMRGFNTLWQPGTDHAGIATQIVVEQRLAKARQTRHDLGREAFLKAVWAWKEYSGSHITEQIRRLGASIDWSREHFTYDTRPGEPDGPLTRATKEAFIRLHDQGLLYRGKRLVNWDPQLNTAISDLEVVSEEKQGSLWYIRYPILGRKEYIVIATTRPETLLGDTAVAVHPDDSRYQKLIGEYIELPLCHRHIPIIGDEQIDPSFGTGCVKVTPGHDFNDYAIGERHQLEIISIFTKDGKIKDSELDDFEADEALQGPSSISQIPRKYHGMDRFQARKEIVKDLTALELIEKIEPHTLSIPHSSRSGVVIEPLLTDQWFIRMKKLAKPAIEACQNGQLELVPDNWTTTYLQWLENIQDWCISRQLWWGHRIPAFYDPDGNLFVGHDEADVRKRHHLSNDIILRQDEDVLDTWFTSALWPLATLGWPDKTLDLETFYPTQVLVTGFDIIFFWVARMVMMGLHFEHKIPFHQVYITGLIRDSQGQKMSKSKGNVLDPIDLIDGISFDTLLQKRTANLMQPDMKTNITQATQKEFPNGIPAFGTDALRFTFCALANTGRNINFDLKRCDGYRNFCNKLWNAARFVLMKVEHTSIEVQSPHHLPDRWIMTILQQLIQSIHKDFKAYRFDRLAQSLYEFVWNEYCDWYVECAKITLTPYILIDVLETVLRLLHPFMPFITEEIWQTIAPLVGRGGKTIMLAPYPETEGFSDPQTMETMNWLKALITTIRTIRAEMNIKPSQLVSLKLISHETIDRIRVEETRLYIKNLAKVEHIEWIDTNSGLTHTATARVDSLEIHIPLEGLVNHQAEIERLTRNIEKLTLDKEKLEIKLNNVLFTEKAPVAVVEKERSRLQQLKEEISQLMTHRSQLSS